MKESRGKGPASHPGPEADRKRREVPMIVRLPLMAIAMLASLVPCILLGWWSAVVAIAAFLTAVVIYRRIGDPECRDIRQLIATCLALHATAIAALWLGVLHKWLRLGLRRSPLYGCVLDAAVLLVIAALLLAPTVQRICQRALKKGHD